MCKKRKWIRICMLLMLVLLLGSCSEPVRMNVTYEQALEDLPEDYSLQQAKRDDCVVYEELQITSGQKVWDQFCAVVDSGGTGTVRLGFYYELEDPSRYDPAYYASIKDDYPALYIMELTYNGSNYTIRWFEDGEEIVRTYKYLIRSEGEPPSSHAAYNSYVTYFLTNEEDVTWDDIWAGMVSSRFGDYIDHSVVYQNYQ